MNLLPFTTQEYEKRLEKIRQQMSQRGLNAFIVSKPEYIYYVSGYNVYPEIVRVSPFMGIIIPITGELRLITRSLERETVKLQWTEGPRVYMDHEDPFRLLGEVLEESKITSGKVGVEENFINARQLNRMRQALPKIEFVDASGVMENVIISPSRTEVEYMRKSAEIANIGFQRGLGLTKVGTHLYEIVGEIHSAMYRAGQTDAGVSIAHWPGGPDGGKLHDATITRKIQRGDLVGGEVVGCYHRYLVSAHGQVYVGDNPPANVVEAYRLASDMYKAGRDAVKSGAKTGDIFDAVNRVYYDARGEDYYRKVGGFMGVSWFGIGLTKDGQVPINPGAVIFVQAVLVQPANLKVSGSILVTESGQEELTKPLLELMTV